MLYPRHCGHLMLRQLRIAAAIVGTLAVLGGVVWVLVASPWLRYEQLEVRGNERVDVMHVRHLASLPEGQALARLDLDAARAGVERHPWVRAARVSRQFPKTVVIEVEERVPVALLQQADGLYLVDAEGVVFARAAAPDLDHPLLTGVDGELATTQPELARKVVRTGLEWLAAAQAQGGLPESALSELRFDPETGYTLFLRNGGEVLLGFAGQERISRLSALTARGLDLAAPHRVDLASDRLAVVTPL